MSEMIERVARAICRSGICGPREHLDEQENLNWRKFELEARAAIEAMREPTPDMLYAGAQTYQGITFSGVPSWTAMIDAALK